MVLTSLSFTLLLTTLLSSTTITTSINNSTTVLRRICGPTKAIDPPSFDVNFVDAMENISQQIAKTGFGLAFSGNISSFQVYSLGQCINYLSNIDCRLCYAEGRVNLPLCLPAVAARVYLDGCFLRYDNYNFSQDFVDSSDTFLCGSSKNISNTVQFREKTEKLILNLTLEAYEESNYYKEGKVLVSPGFLVYGVAQCWKSLNKSGCRECLDNAKKGIVRCLPDSDGRALNAGCFLRYSIDPFFVTASQLRNRSSSAVRRRLGVALGSFFTAVVVIGGAILWGRRRPSDYTDGTNGSPEIIKSITESHLSFKYEDLRKATKNFDMNNKLGQGGYGSVYKGILSDGREIAVKRLFFNTTQWLDQFFNEVNLISRVQHKNLVKLLGCSVEGPESLLVYEYLSNTSLDQSLFDSFRKKDLDWRRRFEIIVGTGEGLAYLHEASEIRIIHRDIKASNILLDDRFKPKISDFGLARYFAEGQSHLSTGIAGTIGYMAPEYVIHGQLTEKADVYSYGVLVLEVLTGRKNTSSISASKEGQSLLSQIWGHFNTKTLMEMLDPQLQGQCSEENVLKVFQIGLLCAQASPSLRPPMWKVVEMLNSAARDLPLPSRPPFINIKGVEPGSSRSEASLMFSSSSKSPVSVNQMSLSIMRGR